MLEKLVPIDLPPGLFHNGTKYESKGRWYDGHLIRWHNGVLQPVGGWALRTANAVTGRATAIISYIIASGAQHIVVGTTTGLWALNGSTWTDITPSGFSGAAGTTWQLDTFGDFLIASCLNGGGSTANIFTWDGNFANDAQYVVTPNTDPPFDVLGGVVVTPERFIFALGANGDYRNVMWPDQASTSDWTPTATNQAGDLILQTQGALVCGRRLRGQTFLWTTDDVWSATYIGGQFVYSFRQEGQACGIISARGVATADGRAFWMGRKGFFVYDGWVKPLECDVYDKVFGEIDNDDAPTQNSIYAWANTDFNEIWWFYPTSGTTNNRYVKYNYATGAWDYGELGRQAATSVPGDAPLAVDDSGFVWKHETGQDRGSEVPYIESGPFEVGDGDNVMRIQRLVPDENTLGETRMVLYTSFNPTSAETENGPYSPAQPTDVRLTARQFRVRIEQVTETGWRVGKPKMGVIPLGHR